MVYGIFETQYEPHPLPISKFRTWENRTIETCHTPPTSHDDETSTSSRQRKNCLPRFMASPPTTVPLALYPSPPRPRQINLAQSSILQRARLLFRFLKTWTTKRIFWRTSSPSTPRHRRAMSRSFVAWMRRNERRQESENNTRRDVRNSIG